MIAAEIATIEAIPVEPVHHSAADAMEVAAKILLRDNVPEDAATRIVCAALMPEWTAGAHTRWARSTRRRAKSGSATRHQYIKKE